MSQYKQRPSSVYFNWLALHFFTNYVTNLRTNNTCAIIIKVCLNPQMHIVHYNKKYSNLSVAMDKEDGLAVLGFFFEVRHYGPM